jgi:hypothetical protein
MRLPRFRVRTLLIAVGILAVLMGGGLEYLRLRRSSKWYRHRAWCYGENARMRLRSLAALKPELERLKESGGITGNSRWSPLDTII